MPMTEKTLNKLLKNRKIKRSEVSFLLAIITLLAVVLVSFENPLRGLENTLGRGNRPPKEFSLHFIDVGQGDCTLLMSDGETMLIDSGAKGYETTVSTYLYSLGVSQLDYIVATHPHSDHIGSMPKVIKEFTPEMLITPYLTPEQTPDTVTYEDLLTAVTKTNCTIFNPAPGEIFTVGYTTVEVLGPVTNEAEDLNDMSLMMMVTYKDNKFLLTGDAKKEEEMSVLESGANVDCDLLHVSHHGSNTSSTDEFLEKATPDYAVISCGIDNDYGHPHAETISKLEKYTDKIYRTDICSDIVVTSDGKNIEITYELENKVQKAPFLFIFHLNNAVLYTIIKIL